MVQVSLRFYQDSHGDHWVETSRPLIMHIVKHNMYTLYLLGTYIYCCDTDTQSNRQNLG